MLRDNRGEERGLQDAVDDETVRQNVVSTSQCARHYVSTAEETPSVLWALMTFSPKHVIWISAVDIWSCLADVQSASWSRRGVACPSTTRLDSPRSLFQRLRRLSGRPVFTVYHKLPLIPNLQCPLSDFFLWFCSSSWRHWV